MDAFIRKSVIFSAIIATSLPGLGLAQMACFPAATGPNPITSTALRRTVVVTADGADRPIFTRPPQEGFGLERALQAIVTSAGPGTSGSPVGMLNSLRETLLQTNFHNPVSGMEVVVAPRQGEANIPAVEMLAGTGANGFHPVALFNRFDLHAADFSNCGEYRIVYAKGTGQIATDRMTLILEAVVPNRSGERRNCENIVRFWDSMSDPGLSTAEMGRRLERFYFAGDLNGDGQSDLPDGGAVISARNLGLADPDGSIRGQVRGNLFVNHPSFLWELREWGVALNSGTVALEARPVGQNPNPDFWRPPQPGETALMQALRGQFRQAMAGDVLRILLSPETPGAGEPPRSGSRLLASLGAGYPDNFNTFVSIARPQDDPAANGQAFDPELLQLLTAALSGFPAAQACGTTVAHVRVRAAAVTCAGCHDFSVGNPVARDVNWPPAQGRFVHVNEQGGLSAALTEHFLPERRRVMDRFLAPAPAGAFGAPPTLAPAVSGRRVH
jgi:hypothetical protein